MLTPADFDRLYLPAGVALGLAGAAPVGPVNLLVIQRAICDRVPAAMLIGLAAAFGDMLFAAFAAFGLAALMRFLGDFAAPLRLIGGALMLGFAVALWRSVPHLEARSLARPIRPVAIAAFSMTVTNPATLLFFLGSFGAIGFVGIGHDTGAHALNAGQVVIGVFIGSALWWLAVCALARYLRSRISDGHLRRLNHGTAALLALFGVVAMAAGLMTLFGPVGP